MSEEESSPEWLDVSEEESSPEGLVMKESSPEGSIMDKEELTADGLLGITDGVPDDLFEDPSRPPVHEMWFEHDTWEPLDAEGKVQYGRFVAGMIERIENDRCTWPEVSNFFNLIATEHNWDFMDVAMPNLPGFNAGQPHVKGEFGTAFLNLLRLENRQRTSNENMPERDRYVDGLSTAEVDYLKRTFFGPNQGLEISERMNRLFKSTLELGFPQPALDQLVREARGRGTDIERSVDGLPTNLHMPARPEESLAGPPGIQRAPGERVKYKAYYKPDDESFDYDKYKGQAPILPPQTADGPKSASLPGHAPDAAGSKSKVIDSKSIEVLHSDPIDIPWPRRT